MFFQRWLKDTCVFALDPEEIEKNSKTMQKSAKVLVDLFTRTHAGKQKGKPDKLAADVLTDITKFMKNMPLIKVMCNKGVKDRHWTEISKIMPFKVHSDMDMALARFVDLELYHTFEQLEEISDTASKVYFILLFLSR